MLESTGGWIKEKTLAKTRVYEGVWELVCNAKSMCGIEMLGLSEAWKKSCTVHSWFCKVVVSDCVYWI